MIMKEDNSSDSRAESAALLDLRHRFSYSDLHHPAEKALYEHCVHLPERQCVDAATRYTGTQQRERDDDMLRQMDPVNILQMEVKLPPVPTILGELQEVTSDDNASTLAVSEVLSRDPSLTAWILKLVNSPFYGFSIKIDTVTRAVTLLGMQQIKTLAMGGMMQELTARIAPGVMDMNSFWRHSLAVGLIAKHLWEAMGRESSERLMVGGLLHDCGLLALAFAMSRTFKALGAYVLQADKPRHLVEREVLSFDHARLGGMLLHRWNMPLPLVMCALRHHEVEDPKRYPEAAVVHVADIASLAALNGRTVIPALDPVVWDSLNITSKTLCSAVDGMLSKLEDICTAMLG